MYMNVAEDRKQPHVKNDNQDPIDQIIPLPTRIQVKLTPLLARCNSHLRKHFLATSP